MSAESHNNYWVSILLWLDFYALLIILCIIPSWIVIIQLLYEANVLISSPNSVCFSPSATTHSDALFKEEVVENTFSLACVNSGLFLRVNDWKS